MCVTPIQLNRSQTHACPTFATTTASRGRALKNEGNGAHVYLRHSNLLPGFEQITLAAAGVGQRAQAQSPEACGFALPVYRSTVTSQQIKSNQNYTLWLLGPRPSYPSAASRPHRRAQPLVVPEVVRTRPAAAGLQPVAANSAASHSSRLAQSG